MSDLANPSGRWDVSPFAELPFGGGVKTDLALTANRAYFCLLPREALGQICTGIDFIVETMPGSGDSIDLGLYTVEAGGLTRLVSTGAQSQRLLFTALSYEDQVDPRRLSVGITPTKLPNDKDVYVALAYGPNTTPPPPTLTATDQGMGIYLAGSPAHAAPGKVKALFKDAAYPLPATVVEPYGLQVAPNLAALFTRRILCVGDSIMKGGTAIDTNIRSVPTKLATRLGPYAQVLNAGVSADTTTDVIARTARDITQQKPKETLLLIGANDLLGGARTDAAIITDLTTIYNSIEAAGSTVIGIPVLPFHGTAIGGGSNGTNEARRLLVNTWIKTTSGRASIDLETVVGDGAGATAALLGGFDSGDHLHLNNAGYDAMAAAIFAAAPFSGRMIGKP